MKFNFLPALKGKRGFTLIELLVVIGILGILAAALVATIDPFEQLKKAQDANVKNVLVEFNDAVIRYYADHNAYPWDATANGGGGCNNATQPVSKGSGVGGLNLGTDVGSGNQIAAGSCVGVLLGDNELKQSFWTDLADLSKIYITYDSGDNLVIGCFYPQSKASQTDTNTQYDQDGGTDSNKNCNQPNNAQNGCYWCTR